MTSASETVPVSASPAPALPAGAWNIGRGRGRWAYPAFAERVSLTLGLVAKSVLAWHVYAGTLAES
jgi:hypothetical protein